MGWLTNLPSRGVVADGSTGFTVMSRPATYICTHDTTPPESQVLKMGEDDQLARYYSNKAKAEVQKAAGAGKGSTSGTKRSGTNLEAAAAKKKATGAAAAPASTSAGPSSAAAKPKTPTYTLGQLKSMTGKELSEILRSLKLPVTGRKEELVRRISDHQLKQKKNSGK